MKRILIVLLMVTGLFAEKEIKEVVYLKHTIFKDGSMDTHYNCNSRTLLYITMKQYETFLETVKEIKRLQELK